MGEYLHSIVLRGYKYLCFLFKTQFVIDPFHISNAYPLWQNLARAWTPPACLNKYAHNWQKIKVFHFDFLWHQARPWWFSTVVALCWWFDIRSELHSPFYLHDHDIILAIAMIVAMGMADCPPSRHTPYVWYFSQTDKQVNRNENITFGGGDKHIIITSKQRFDVIIACLLRRVLAGLCLSERKWAVACITNQHVQEKLTWTVWIM